MKNYKNQEINRLILESVSTKYAFKTQPKISPIKHQLIHEGFGHDHYLFSMYLVHKLKMQLHFFSFFFIRQNVVNRVPEKKENKWQNRKTLKEIIYCVWVQVQSAQNDGWS